MKHKTLYSSLFLCILSISACGKDDDDRRPSNNGPGLNLGNADFAITNNATEKEFYARANKVERLLNEAQEPVEKFAQNDMDDQNENDDFGGRKMVKRAAKSSKTNDSLSYVTNEQNVFSGINNWYNNSLSVKKNQPLSANEDDSSLEDSSEDSSSAGVASTDYGKGFESLDNCADAIGQVKQSYKQTLSMLQEEFKYLQKLESGAGKEDGFKKVQKENAALAYEFETEEDGGAVTGTIEGSADESRVKIVLDAKQKMNSQDTSSSRSSSSGSDRNSNNEVLVNVTVASLANLKDESIDTRIRMGMKQDKTSLLDMNVQSLINGGSKAGVQQKFELSFKDAETGKAQTFSMSLAAQVLSERSMNITLKTSGFKNSEESVPALDLTYQLSIDSKGMCKMSNGNAGNSANSKPSKS